ncbi:MAG: 50S ribosomal protein L9 [Bacillota bacterium]|nr:50S ribosomal protein L9 [Bacillota bacterium]HHU43849.1 50S ribosomal protein L9 [Clostridiales bacterium]
MKIILLEDIKSIGKKGDLAEVNDGYARNYLIPKKLAMKADKSAINEYKHRKEKEERELQAEKEKALKLKDTLTNKAIEVKVKCGEGKMYGRVTSQDIADALLKEGIEIDKRKIILSQPIKELGEHIVEVKVYKETSAKLKINVVKDEG